MARSAVLMLLRALALVTVATGVVAKCGHRQWPCGNGQCIDAQWRCDGSNTCADKSDEDPALCGKAPSMRMRVGQVTAVRVEFKEEYKAIEFFLCDFNSCSYIYLNGRTADGTPAYWTGTECDPHGRKCKESKHHPLGWDYFPAGPLVVKVQRHRSELAVWLDGYEHKVATVAVKEGSDLLRLRPWYWTSDLRVEFGVPAEPSLGPDAGDAELPCANGGTAFVDTCICKPGFSGILCDQACGPDKFGERCERSCSKDLTGTVSSNGCSGVRFLELGGSSGKSTCGAGFHGPHCNQVCDGTRYGANCSEACGQCAGAGRCDPYTGECYAGCVPGYHGANCKQEFTYLVAAPNVTKTTSYSVEGSVLLHGNTAGSGSAKFVRVENRKVHDGDWSTGAMAEVEDEASAVTFTVEGLAADSDVELRAILLDERMRGRPNAPQLRVRTRKGVLRGVAATEIRPGSVLVTWRKSDWSLPVLVEHKCEAGCPGGCGQSGAVQVAGAAMQAAMLEGLLPAAQYRVTVRAGRQAESITLRTALRAPNVILTFEVVLASNVYAVFKWRTEDSCVGVRGPGYSYRWQLVTTDGHILQNGSTTDASLHLQGLQPGKNYELQVAVTNSAGTSPRTAVNFSTQNSDSLISFSPVKTNELQANPAGPGSTSA